MRTSVATACLHQWLGACLVAVLASGCATTTFRPAETAAVDQLLGLISQRLDVAPAVARVKWNTKAPIEDLTREQEVIDGAARRAGGYGLDPSVAGRFFRGQIEASKTVQNRLHAEWTASKQPPFTDVADLDRDIRPVLDRLTPQLLRALGDAMPAIQKQGGRHLLDTRVEALRQGSPAGEGAFGEAVAPVRELSK